MSQHCRANPCCGDRPCSGIPLPQDASGLPAHNKRVSFPSGSSNPMTIETELPAVKVKWRVFEDITRGWFGIEEDILDGNTILYPKRINREPLDGIVRAHNAALTLKDDPGNGGKSVICIGHHTINQLMAGHDVEIEAAIMVPASDLCQSTAAESRCEELAAALEFIVATKIVSIGDEHAGAHNGKTLIQCHTAARSALSQYSKGSKDDG